MRHDEKAIDHQFNIRALEEMELTIPMTVPERNNLRRWVRQGHEPDSNPWDYRDADGVLLNFLQAFRLRYGYSSGPWDYWRGPEAESLWNEQRRRFCLKDDL